MLAHKVGRVMAAPSWTQPEQGAIKYVCNEYGGLPPETFTIPELDLAGGKSHAANRRCKMRRASSITKHDCY